MSGRITMTEATVVAGEMRVVGEVVETQRQEAAYLVAIQKAVIAIEAPLAGEKDLDQAKNRAVDTGKPPVTRRAKGA